MVKVNAEASGDIQVGVREDGDFDAVLGGKFQVILDRIGAEGKDSEAKIVDAAAKVLPCGEGFARGGTEGTADEEENDGLAEETFQRVLDAVLVEEGKFGSWFSVSDHESILRICNVSDADVRVFFDLNGRMGNRNFFR